MVKILFAIITIVSLSCCGAKKKAANTIPATKLEPSTPIVQTKEKEQDLNGIVTTVRVVRVSCASLVAIITDDAMTSNGEQWAPYNVRMAKPYKGAFTFINQSEFPKLKEGYEFKAKLINEKDAPKHNEPRCAMEDFPPATKFFVKALTEPKEQL